MNKLNRTIRKRASVFAAVLSLSGCLPGATGSVAVHVTGEEAATEGLPFSEAGETIAFADGWTVRFDHYVVALADLAASLADETATNAGPYVADLAKATGEPPAFLLDTLSDVAVGRNRFDFKVVAATADARTFGEVDEEELVRLTDAKASMHIVGTAQKDDATIRFDWLLPTAVNMSDCTNGVDDKQGIIVEENKTADAEITFHVEHIFYDSLGTEGADLRFDALAALAQEGELTTAMLADAAIDPAVYNRASFDVDNMLEFVTTSARSMAHLNGEGLCTLTSP